MIKLNDVEIKPTIFPDNTSQVWKLPEELLDTIYRQDEAVVEWVFENEAEFMHVAQLKTLLDTYTEYVDLRIPYLPYGRQDKRVDNGSTFALHTFSKLVNSLDFREVITLDAHNNSRAIMIKNLTDKNPRNNIFDTIDEYLVWVDLILFPDKGACDRYSAYFPKRKKSLITATKVRDQKTGYIKSITLNGDVKGKSVLIVDDICDGGMTFRLVAKAAKERGAKEVHLYVTHGIFSKGLEVLREDGIDRIFTHKGEVEKEKELA